MDLSRFVADHFDGIVVLLFLAVGGLLLLMAYAVRDLDQYEPPIVERETWTDAGRDATEGIAQRDIYPDEVRGVH